MTIFPFLGGGRREVHCSTQNRDHPRGSEISPRVISSVGLDMKEILEVSTHCVKIYGGRL